MSIYPERESKELEFKKNYPEKGQLIKTCVAFANGSGGEIIIGIEDETRKIIGLKETEINKIFEEVSNSIYDSITPSLIPEIYEKNINGKSVVVIKVYPGSKTPYYIKKEGNKKGVYLRVASSTRRATEEYIEDLYRTSRRTSFDEERSLIKYEELDKELLREVYGKGSIKNKLLADKVILRDEFDPKSCYASNAGVLFFKKVPDEFIPESIIICSQFKGTKGRKILRTEDLQGPIPEIVEKSLILISYWLETNFKVQKNGKLVGSLPIPYEALREAIINALIHRKYFIPGAIKVAIYENRLELFSPGAFPGLISTKTLGDGTTYLRNPIIGKLARRCKLVEKQGTGIRLLFNQCKEMGLKRPEYNEDGEFVKLTFYFDKQFDIGQTDEENIVNLGRQKGQLTIQDIILSLGVSRNTATRKLNNLIDEGLCKRTGRGPSTRYVFNLNS